MDDWKRESDFDLGYERLYGNKEKRSVDAAEDADKLSEDLYWKNQEEYEERRLAAIQKEEEAASPKNDYESEDEALNEIEAVICILNDMPALSGSGDPQKESERKKLKREMKAEALDRLERSAKTPADFKKVTKMWDMLDANRERRERYHEVLLGDTPADSVVDYSQTKIIPRWANDPMERQLQSGNILDYLCNCPYDMHDLLSREYMRKAVASMREEHKEILFFLFLRLYSPQRLAAVRGQTDRNIRKVRDAALRKVRKRIYREMDRLQKNGYSGFTKREREFLETYDPKGKVRRK